jgi:hypothetical protein
MAEISTQNNKKVDNFNRTESDSYLQRILVLDKNAKVN